MQSPRIAVGVAVGPAVSAIAVARAGQRDSITSSRIVTPELDATGDVRAARIAFAVNRLIGGIAYADPAAVVITHPHLRLGDWAGTDAIVTAWRLAESLRADRVGHTIVDQCHLFVDGEPSPWTHEEIAEAAARFGLREPLNPSDPMTYVPGVSPEMP